MGQDTRRDGYYWVNVPGTPVGIVSFRYESLEGEVDSVLKSLCFDAKCGASSSVPPTPTPSPCTPTVRGLSPQKPGDVISPGATYRDASGKEVGIIQERWYFNGKQSTSIVWDGKKVTVEHQWTCLDHKGYSRTYEIPAYQTTPVVTQPAVTGAPPTASVTSVTSVPPPQVTVKPPTPSGGGQPPSSGTSKDTTSAPPPGIGHAGQVPGPASLPQAVTGAVLPGLIAIGVSILGGILGGAPKGGAAPLPPAKPPAPPIPTSPAAVPFPAAPPVAGGTVALPPAGPPSPAGTPAKPAPASPEDKQKAKAEIRQKQEEAIKDHDKAIKASDWWKWATDVAEGIKSGADTGVNILAVVTGAAGQKIKSIYETAGVIADHAGGAIADGKVRDHAIGAITDVASKKLTDMMKDKIGDGAKWAGGKIGNALPGQISGGISSISGKISGGIDSISRKVFGPGTGDLPDLGNSSVTTTIKSIFGTDDKSGQVRKIIWEGGKDLGKDWAKDQVSDKYIQGTTGGRIKGMDDYKQKISDAAQATIKDKLGSWGRKPETGVERFR